MLIYYDAICINLLLFSNTHINSSLVRHTPNRKTKTKKKTNCKCRKRLEAQLNWTQVRLCNFNRCFASHLHIHWHFSFSGFFVFCFFILISLMKWNEVSMNFASDRMRVKDERNKLLFFFGAMNRWRNKEKKNQPTTMWTRCEWINLIITLYPSKLMILNYIYTGLTWLELVIIYFFHLLLYICVCVCVGIDASSFNSACRQVWWNHS